MVSLVEAGGDEAGELGVTLVDGEETLLGEEGRHLRKIVTLPSKNSEVKQKEKEKEKRVRTNLVLPNSNKKLNLTVYLK